MVHLGQMFSNLGHTPGYVSDLLGLTNGLRHNGGVPPVLGEVHVVGALCVLACFVAALSSLVVGIGRKQPGKLRACAPERWRLDDLLLIAVLCSAVSFVVLARADQSGVRYLTVTVVFACVLAGRLVARAWPKIPAGRPVRASRDRRSGRFFVLRGRSRLFIVSPRAAERGPVVGRVAGGSQSSMGDR